jgi:3-hydroxyisobutyrate dehydrogenase-like beta-hydroxyacid dehydrogenase
MSEISVIGLGSMGSTLAKTLLSVGHGVTVWNRSQKKSDLLVAEGAEIGATIADAVKASPIILVCIANYTNTREIFDSDEVLPLLSGRIVVQMSSGTPLEAIADERWFVEQGAGYLDAAILGSPKVIGTKAGQILI